MRRSSCRLAAVTMLAALAACSPDEARVNLSILPDSPLTTADIRVTFEDGLRRWHVDADGPLAFTGEPTRSSVRPFASGPFNTRTDGVLRVSFRASRDGEEISAGSVELELKPDWVWGVKLEASRVDPTSGCFGCLGRKAFGIAPEFRTSERDSIYIVWGGNSIKNPVVY